MTSSHTRPTLVAWLGYGGLIPFLALATLSLAVVFFAAR
jgi:hypothetical protein